MFTSVQLDVPTWDETDLTSPGELPSPVVLPSPVGHPSPVARPLPSSVVLPFAIRSPVASRPPVATARVTIIVVASRPSIGRCGPFFSSSGFHGPFRHTRRQLLCVQPLGAARHRRMSKVCRPNDAGPTSAASHPAAALLLLLGAATTCRQVAFRQRVQGGGLLVRHVPKIRPPHTPLLG